MQREGSSGQGRPLSHGTWVAFDFGAMDTKAQWPRLGLTLQGPGAKMALPLPTLGPDWSLFNSAGHHAACECHASSCPQR